MKDEKCEQGSILSKTVIIRLALGGMLLIYGVSKFQMGNIVFADAVSAGFVNTIIPMVIVKGFLIAVPTIEVILGTALLLGLFTRVAAKLAALLFTIYILGLTAQQNGNNIIGIIANYIYIYAAFKLICCSKSIISIDYFLQKKKSKKTTKRKK